jgi:signal transduction histidine kinase/ligand-binding sensor domain-containing protein/CheY-like chemotaxis protein
MATARTFSAAAALVVCLAIPVRAQRYNFKFYGEQEGLRDQVVQVVLQDRAGFLWVGTQNGLFRYDGSRFVEFTRNEGLPGTQIESLHESADGTLWVGTSSGLARRANDRFESIPIRTNDDEVAKAVVGRQGIASDSKNRLFLATERGLIRASPNNGRWQFQRLTSSNISIRSVFVNSSDVAWFGCGTDLCTLDQDRVREVGAQLGLPGESWFAILGNTHGDLWVRSVQGVYRRKAGASRFEQLPGLPESRNTIPTATLDLDGNILVPTDRGLARERSGDSAAAWELVNVDQDIGGEAISSVLADREGFVWLGLGGSGLARWVGYGEWQSWTQQEGLSRSSVWSIAKSTGKDMRMWAGTRFGLSVRDANGKWTPRLVAGVEWARSVAPASDGSVWIAADSAGLVHFDAGSGATRRFQLGTAVHVLVDHQQRVWASTRQGLFRMRAGSGTFERLTPSGTTEDEGFEFAVEDAAGQIWVCGDLGLVLYTGETSRRFTVADGLKTNAVALAAPAADGSIWIGYREALGLTHLIFRNGQVHAEHVTAGDGAGLHSDKAIFLAFDHTGRLWAGTDHGIDVYDQTRWRHFGRADGLIWDDCNDRAILADDDGMWIGTSRGLSHYRPRKIPVPPISPNVVLTTVRFGTESAASSGVIANDIPYEHRDLYIQYAALTFAQDAGITFQIRIDGNLQERLSTDLNIASLEPGRHVLEVMARNSRGMWSVEPARIDFTIATPWYLSWWFRCACIGGLMILARLFWLHRTHRLRAERERLEKAVAERTKELSLEKARAEFETTVVQGQKVEIERLLVEAQQASKLKSEFLANMSHELRTPMNGVMGMTDLVLATTLVPEQREYLESARGAADSLLNILNDILDFSKIEAGRLDLNPIEFSLSEVLDTTHKMFALPVDAKELVYVSSVAPDVPDSLIGDPDRLRQILINFVGNAVKFTEKGSIAVRVERESIGPNSTLLRFEVRDTGVGIPEDKQGVIFESFRQADGSMTRKYGGTGLGLSICARLVELMGGAISVESELRKGSVFRFTARFGLAIERAVPVAEIAPSAPATPTEHPEVLLRVLLAEDNAINQRLATRLLEKRGHQVILAATGREALAKLEEHEVDVILMDVQMPDMNGLQATGLIRESEKQRGWHIPVIALTAHTIKGDREKCIDAGMDAYITKPVNAQELIAVLEATAASFSRVPR